MLPYLIILLAFLADRLTKRWAAGFLGENGETRIYPLLTIRETYNEGIIFGLFQGIGPLVGWLTVFVIAGLFLYLAHLPREETMLRIGLALIIGGASGNLLDRLTTGQVLDFLETPIRTGVFNVADICIYLGIFLVLIATLFRRAQEEEEGQQTLDANR